MVTEPSGVQFGLEFQNLQTLTLQTNRTERTNFTNGSKPTNQFCSNRTKYIRLTTTFT